MKSATKINLKSKKIHKSFPHLNIKKAEVPKQKIRQLSLLSMSFSEDGPDNSQKEHISQEHTGD